MTTTYLRDLGLEAAGRWLDEHFASLGERSTLDMIKTYE